MFNDTEDLEKLAETCLETARTLKQYLASNGHPQPTFEQNGPTSFPLLPPDIQFAQLKLREASLKIHDLVCPPEFPVTIYPYFVMSDLTALKYVLTYDVAKHVPDNDSVLYEDLAAKTGTNINQLKQIIRQCCQNHVFTEKDGKVAHTVASKALGDRSHRATTEYMVLDTWDYLHHAVPSIEKWGHGSEEPNQTPFNHATGTDMQMFQYYEQNPIPRERFGNVMSFAASLPGLSRDYVGIGFDWASLGSGKVVDVAGNMGQCSAQIVKINPKLQLIVQDLPTVIEAAKDPKTSGVPPELLPNITFMAHDMFQPQPITDADLYFYRMVFHNQSDKYAAKLLQALIPSMKPGARLVISDQVLPPVGTAPGPVERFMRAQDLQMWTLLNARQRDRQQWNELFEKADKRLKVKNVISPVGSVNSFLEVVLE